MEEGRVCTVTRKWVDGEIHYSYSPGPRLPLPASREEQWPLSCAALQELPVKTVAGRLVLESSDTSHPTPFWKTRMPPQSTLGDGPTGSELLNQNILNRWLIKIMLAVLWRITTVIKQLSRRWNFYWQHSVKMYWKYTFSKHVRTFRVVRASYQIRKDFRASSF